MSTTALGSGVSHVAKQAGMNPMLDFAAKEIDYQMTGVVAHRDCLKSNAEALRRFLRAYVESIRYYKTNRAGAIKETMKAICTDEGKPTLKGIQLAIDVLAKENPKAKNVTPQRVIGLSFLP